MKNANINRINELIAQITAFSKEGYAREELLPELFELQRQLVELIFNGTHADLARLKIWDVEKHLIQLNEAKGHVADEELEKVLATCKEICNLISSEITGNAGEKKAFWALQKVRGTKSLMKNVEFTVDEHRTELDAILFTPKAIFVVEVKNPRKSVVIDERGNYCRVSNTLVFDKNIGEKMSDKVHLLREALQDTDQAALNIESIVVFTNNDIEVENRFPFIRTCFLSELPHIIEGYVGDKVYTEEDINRMAHMVDAAACKEDYPAPFDMEQFKHDFASLVVKLEDAEEFTGEEDDQATEDTDEIEAPMEAEEHSTSDDINITALVGIASGIAGFVLGTVVTCLFKMGRR